MVGFWTLLSRILGMVREILLSALIGAGPLLDAADNVEGRLGRDALNAAAKKSKIRVVATQSFSFTQESVVNSIPLVRAVAPSSQFRRFS